jgi:hypothetical protein
MAVVTAQCANTKNNKQYTNKKHKQNEQQKNKLEVFGTVHLLLGYE